MRELDLVLSRYLDHYGPQFSAAEFETFTRLLEVNDMSLYSWLTGREVPADAAFKHIVELMLALEPTAVTHQ